MKSRQRPLNFLDYSWKYQNKLKKYLEETPRDHVNNQCLLNNDGQYDGYVSLFCINY